MVLLITQHKGTPPTTNLPSQCPHASPIILPCPVVPPLPLPVLAHGPRTCKISCRMCSCTGPQLLMTCEWRDAYLETSVGHDTHRTSGTSNDASYILLIPLTGSKNHFSAPNGSPKRSGLTATWPISYLIWAGSCLYISDLSIEHFRWAKKSRWPAYPPPYVESTPRRMCTFDLSKKYALLIW